MGGGASKEPTQDDFTDMVAEYKKVEELPEEEQFQHMRKKFKAKQEIWTNINPQQNNIKKNRGLHNHFMSKFKLAAKVVGKLEGAMHYNKGLRTSDIDFHGSAASYNTPHPELQHDALIREALSETIFAKSEKQAIKKAIKLAEEKVLDAGTCIIQLGESGDTYYIVESGSLILYDKDNNKTGSLVAGQHFGELSLIYNDSAEATIKVSEDGPAKVWMMKREVFKKVQQETHGGALFKRAQWLRQVEAFKVLSDQALMRICHALDPVTIKPGAVIAEQGQHGEAMYLIVSGTVEEFVSGRRHSASEADHTQDHKVTTLGPQEYFGEHALINRPHHYNATYKAGDQEVELLKMTQGIMDEILGPLAQVLEEHDILNSLISSELFVNVPNAIHKINAAHLAHDMLEQKIEISDKEVIFGPTHATKKESEGLYVLKTGTITGYRNEGVDKFSDGDTFGEECIVPHPEYGTAPPEDIVSAEDGVLYLLKKATLADFLSKHEVLPGDDSNKAHCADRSGIKWGDLTQLGLLGEGSFGTVTMVKAMVTDANTGETTEESLALKRMGKNHLVEEDMLESTQQEKDILFSLSPHPFVLRLYTTFQDDCSVFMLTNLVQGGELYDYLHQGEMGDKELDTAQAKFYTANIFLALSHLHEHGFVYRDMKPENVLIGADGYLCLIDLGFAKACPYHIDVDGSDVYHEQCFTTCGTPEYMAPEFIFQTGHDKGADYWAMGCLVFEMFHGFTPFVDRQQPDDLSQIFVNIALHNNSNYELPWKKGFANSDEASFVNAILQPKSVYRLGVVNKGRKSFMEHEWFKGFNWDKLYNKAIDGGPPMVPAVKDKFDKSNFGNKQSQLSPDKFDPDIYETDPFVGW